MDNFPKMSQCLMRETYRREPSSSSYILVSRSLEDGTWGLLVSWSLTVRSSSLGRVIIDRCMEADFGSVWGQTSGLPCPYNLCGNACGAWPAYQGYLVMINHGFSRPLKGPQSSGRCLAFFAVLDGVGDIFGRAFRSACTLSGVGILGTWRTS